MAVVRHGDGLGEALGFVVDPSGAHRVDVAPVGFGLWVDKRIAIAFRCRGEQEASSLGFGEAEGLVGAERPDLEGLDGQLEIVDGRCRGGEVQHKIQPARNVDEVGHIMLDKDEPIAAEKMLDILEVAGDEVVHADHIEPLFEESFAQMRAEESRASGHQRPLSIRHAGLRAGA